MISDFCRDVYEICSLLGITQRKIVDFFLPNFRDNL